LPRLHDKRDSILNLINPKRLSATDNIAFQVLKGSKYFSSRQLDSAQIRFLNAQNLAENSEHKGQLISIYNFLGTISAQLGEFSNAESYFTKALQLNNLSEAFVLGLKMNLASVKKELKKNIEAKTIYEEILPVLETKELKNYLATSYVNLSSIYSDLGDIDSAIENGEKGRLLKIELNQNLTTVNNNLGYAYLRKGESSKAIPYLEKAKKGASLEQQLLINSNLIEAYTNKGDYKKALSFAELRDAVKDSITKLSYDQKIVEITEAYESEKKEQAIIDLKQTNKQKNTLLWALLALGLVSSLAALFWFQNYKAKQELEETKLKQRFKQLQLNPHFLFHALTSINQFIRGNKPDVASEYLTSFSKLMRQVLETSDFETVTLADEIEMLEAYLKLEQLNSNQSFTYSIDIANSIETDFTKIPTMLIQPFVENAIEHGLSDIENGIIKLSFKPSNSSLIVSIEDNGIGLQADPKKASSKHTSLSSSIIEKRISYLNKNEKDTPIHLALTSPIKEFNSGTSVVLTFKNIL